MATVNGEEYKFPDEKTAERKEDKIEFEIEGAEAAKDGIEIVDDTPEQDRGRKPLGKPVEEPTDEELAQYGEKVKTRISELTHARHDERRAKEVLAREKAELERIAQAMLEENRQLKQVVDAGSKQFVSVSVAAAEKELESARREYEAAQEAFEPKQILAAQEKLMDAKLALDAAKKIRPTSFQDEKDVVQPRQEVPTAAAPDQRTLSWQAKNQWFGADGYEEHTAFALGVHKKLVSSGITPNSDEYYSRIDARMKQVFPDLFGESQREEKSATKPPAAVVAPSSRSTSSNKVRLTATQVALANKLGIPLQQYAAQVARLNQEARNG